jgi:signal transduction histidine kinase
MKAETLQVLLVEDNAGDARLLREMFSKEKADSFELTHLLRMSDAETHLAKGGVDIVLLDMGLPDAHGIETIQRARAVASDIPMIVLTGLEDEALAAEAMKEGAQDYLIKGQIENRALPRALRYAIERHHMQMETELIRTQQLNLKDEFLSHVSHELRSPLTSIYSFSSIIADGMAGETSALQDEYLQIILNNVNQLQAMIEDLLMVMQTQTGKLTVNLLQTSVADAVVYAVDTLRRSAVAKAITVTFNPSATLRSAYADPTRLRQILTILLDNAIKFTPTGGAVKIGVQLFEDNPTFLRVEVSDTGCGISPKVAERIFERLYQVSDPGEAGRNGLGLGLYIAQDLVARQGGKIWVRSELLRGSHFSFTVPVFSLENLIGPILTHERKSGEAIALLAVEIHSKGSSLAVPSAILSLARTLLRQCLRPDTDLLLPNVDGMSDHQLLCVIAYTQEQGLEVIGKRILSQLRHNEQLQPEDFTISVSHSFLDLISRGANESMESFVGQVAAGIQDRIKKQSLHGGIKDEPKENPNCGR